MKNSLQITLLVREDQFLKLLELQKTFALACDEAASFVIRSRSWHRVTLHHLAYKSMREKFPELGSQMVCNAIHTVSKACKEIFQDQNSKWSSIAKSGAALPTLKFANNTPVFFDKHTLTIKKNTLSIFTMDGRMYIQINLKEEVETRLRNEKLKELSLYRKKNVFHLRFVFREDIESPLQIKPSVKIISTLHQESLPL